MKTDDAWCICCSCFLVLFSMAGDSNCCWCALTTASYADIHFLLLLFGLPENLAAIMPISIYNFERNTSMNCHRWTAFRLSRHRWLLLFVRLPAAIPLWRIMKFLFCLRFLLSQIPLPPSNCSLFILAASSAYWQLPNRRHLTNEHYIHLLISLHFPKR